MEELTLRDRLAISMPFDGIPTLNDEYALNLAVERSGIVVDKDDPFWMVEFSLSYQAMIRYMYADEMLRVRDVKI